MQFCNSLLCLPMLLWTKCTLNSASKPFWSVRISDTNRIDTLLQDCQHLSLSFFIFLKLSLYIFSQLFFPLFIVLGKSHPTFYILDCFIHLISESNRICCFITILFYSTWCSQSKYILCQISELPSSS